MITRRILRLRSAPGRVTRVARELVLGEARSGDRHPASRWCRGMLQRASVRGCMALWCSPPRLTDPRRRRLAVERRVNQTSEP